MKPPFPTGLAGNIPDFRFGHRMLNVFIGTLAAANSTARSVSTLILRSCERLFTDSYNTNSCYQLSNIGGSSKRFGKKYFICSRNICV